MIRIEISRAHLDAKLDNYKFKAWENIFPWKPEIYLKSLQDHTLKS